MPQIPVFTPNQRIDASTPVAAINTTDARMMGEATAGLGSAMERLGTILDRTAKRAAAQEDEYLITQAVNETRIAMMAASEKQKQMGIQPEDDPTGISGVNRFRESTKEYTDQVSARLPERLRSQYQATMSGHEVGYSAQVLANEVAKREANVMMLRQDNVNKQATIVRGDLTQLDSSLAQVSAAIAGDTMMAAADKPKFDKSSSQDLIKAAAQGLMQQRKFGEATKLVQSPKYAAHFTPEELAKEVDKIQTEEAQFYNTAYNRESQDHARRERAEKSERDKKIDRYISWRMTQGDSLSDISNDIQFNQDMPTALKNAQLENLSLRQIDAEAFENNVMTRYANGEDVLDSVRSAEDRGSIPLESGKNIRDTVKAIDGVKADPLLRQALDDGQKTLESFKEPRLFDPVTNTYKEADQTVVERTRAMLYMEVSKLARQGKATPEAIKNATHMVMRNQFTSQSTVVPVSGIPRESLDTSKGVQAEINKLRANYKAGVYKTPEQQEALKQQLRGLIINSHRASLREELAKNPTQNMRDK